MKLEYKVSLVVPDKVTKKIKRETSMTDDDLVAMSESVLTDILKKEYPDIDVLVERL